MSDIRNLLLRPIYSPIRNIDCFARKQSKFRKYIFSVTTISFLVLVLPISLCKLGSDWCLESRLFSRLIWSPTETIEEFVLGPFDQAISSAYQSSSLPSLPDETAAQNSENRLSTEPTKEEASKPALDLEVPEIDSIDKKYVNRINVVPKIVKVDNEICVYISELSVEGEILVAEVERQCRDKMAIEFENRQTEILLSMQNQENEMHNPTTNEQSLVESATNPHPTDWNDVPIFEDSSELSSASEEFNPQVHLKVYDTSTSNDDTPPWEIVTENNYINVIPVATHVSKSSGQCKVII